MAANKATLDSLVLALALASALVASPAAAQTFTAKVIGITDGDTITVLRGGVTVPGARCGKPVSLVDLYPTLLDLCGLPADPELDGKSLRPLLRHPDAEWDHPALITAGASHAIRTERWRYIRYYNGAEELYDHSWDEHEWINLITVTEPRYRRIADELAARLPTTTAEPIVKSAVPTRETDTQ